MHVFFAIVGAALVLFTLRDIFHTLFHPSGSGAIGESLSKWTWDVFRAWSRLRASRQQLPLAGPTSLVAIIATWALLLWLGWGLFLWPFALHGFAFNDRLTHQSQYAILDALYLSIMNLATLGAADVAPHAEWLRLFAPIEALIGFVLLTASVSWVLSIYPALERRQSTANEIALIQDSEADGKRLADASPDYAAEVLTELKASMVTLRGDLIQFPITYYFHALDERDNFAAVLSYLYSLAVRIESETDSPTLNYAAHMLVASLYDLARILGQEFLKMENTDDPAAVFARYRQDHMSEERNL
jgi:Ion channel